MRVFHAEMHRAVFSWRFAAAVFGIAAAAVIGTAHDALPYITGAVQEAPYSGFSAALCAMALSSDVFLAALPLLAALPATASFVEDLHTRFVRAALPRAGRRAYLSAKAWSAGLCGGLAAAAGALIAMLLLIGIFAPMETAASLLPEEQAAESERTLLFLSGRVLLSFLCGALWSQTGAVAAALTNSTYMAWAAPFVLYYLFLILTTRYFPRLLVLNPNEWMNPGPEWPGGIAGAVLLESELCLAAGTLEVLAARRRLPDA